MANLNNKRYGFDVKIHISEAIIRRKSLDSQWLKSLLFICNVWYHLYPSVRTRELTLIAEGPGLHTETWFISIAIFYNNRIKTEILYMNIILIHLNFQHLNKLVGWNLMLECFKSIINAKDCWSLINLCVQSILFQEKKQSLLIKL